MRNYEGMRLPPATDPHLRNELLKVDKYLKQLQAVVKNSFGKGNSPGVVVSGGSGSGGAGALPDHKHTGSGDGGGTFGEYQGLIKYYGKHVYLDRTAPQIQMGDASTTGKVGIKFHHDPALGSLSPGYVYISWGENNVALSAPATTVGATSVLGARMVMYKTESDGTFDAVYGQGVDDNWVMPGPEAITYSIFSGVTYPGASFLRGQWQGNGDYYNYGAIRIKKNTGAAVPTTPGLQLEETGSGTDLLSLRAPAALPGNRTQIFMGMTGRIPLVGDDPPGVASGALGMVDSTAVTAAVASTNISNNPLTGVYQVNYYLACTTANAGASSVTFQVNFTDDVGATSTTGSTALVCTATGHAHGVITLYRASGEISYQTNWTTPSSAVMSLRVRITYLG